MRVPRAVLGAGVALCALVASTAEAQTTPVIYYACRNTADGTIRMINGGPQLCRKNEIWIFWNQTGPTGPTGPIGPAGPTGPTGPAGPAATPCIPAGTCSLTGRTGCAYDRNCAPGETCTWQGAGDRFVQNGDGTVTDRRTCLMWEKKTGSWGSWGGPYGYICPNDPSPTCADPHDVNNRYTWSTVSHGTPANFDGAAATVFLKTLNATAFAGHSDWRLPTSAGDPAYWARPGTDPELESILLAPYPCTTNPCIDTDVFGPVANVPNQEDYYWSATRDIQDGVASWCVDFSSGGVRLGTADSAYFVRAVRSVQ